MIVHGPPRAESVLLLLDTKLMSGEVVPPLSFRAGIWKGDGSRDLEVVNSSWKNLVKSCINY